MSELSSSAAEDLPRETVKLRRLRKRAEFLFVAQGATAARGAVMIQGRRREGALDIGAGFTATKRIGGAVVRNRAKRRLREAARLVLPLHGEPGHDYVFVARSGTATRAWERLVDDVKSALISLAAGGDGPRPPRKGPHRSSPPRPSPGTSAPRSAPPGA